MGFDSNSKSILLMDIGFLMVRIRPWLALGDVDSILDFERVKGLMEEEFSNLDEYLDDFKTTILDLLRNSCEVE